MSQRREKRFRQLERRVAVLENLAFPAMEIQQESKLAGMTMDAEWESVSHRKGMIRRFLDFIFGKGETWNG